MRAPDGHERREFRVPRNVRELEQLLGFHPWMLAAAVILACALGVAVMEELRGPRVMWAQATPAAETRAR